MLLGTACATACTALAFGAAEPRAQAQEGERRPPPPELVWPDPNEKRARLRGADLASLRRLVANYDFEDAERFPRLLPPNWYRVLSSSVARPGYPDFGTVGLSDDLAHGGRWSLRFDLDGGNMAVALPPAVVRVFPGSRYRLTLWVRTEGLTSAGARAVVRFHGADGAPTGDEFQSDPIRTNGEWVAQQIELPEIPQYAVDLSLELEVVQPSAVQPFASRRPLDDVTGRVWFDDLQLWQIPVIRFTADGVGQIFPTGQAPTVTVSLHDLVSERLTTRIHVRDVDGHLVASSDATIAGSGGKASVPLGITEPGWYRATMEVLDPEGFSVAVRELDLAIVEHRSARPRGGAPQFGVTLPTACDASSELEQALLSAVAPDFAVLPLWRQDFDSTRTPRQVEVVRPLVESLLDQRIEPVFALTSVPTDAARSRHIDLWQVLLYFGADDSGTRAVIEPWLFAFGQHVSRWQVGSLESSWARDDFDLAAAQRIQAFFDRSVASLNVLIPAVADTEPSDASRGITRNVLVPWGARAGTTGEYARPWQSDDAMFTLELAPVDAMEDRTRVNDLAHRALDAWREGIRRLAITLPMRPARLDGTPAALLPEAIAWRELASWLSDRSFGGELSLGEGIEAWIVRGKGSTAVVAWSSDGATRSVEMPFGTRAIRVRGLMGRTATVEASVGGHRFDVTSSPVLLEDVDPALVTFLASARLEPATLEGRRAGQVVELVLTNPFVTSLSGTVSTSDRADWTLSPRHQPFAIPAGGETRLPMRVTLPRSALAGDSLLAFDLELSASESQQARLHVPITIGWPAVEVSSTWRLARSLETGGVDVIVAVEVTNRSGETLDLEAFAAGPGYTQMRRPVMKLASGASATRRFQFADGARLLSGESVIAGVNDLQGDKRFATAIAIPPFLPRAKR